MPGGVVVTKLPPFEIKRGSLRSVSPVSVKSPERRPPLSVHAVGVAESEFPGFQDEDVPAG